MIVASLSITPSSHRLFIGIPGRDQVYVIHEELRNFEIDDKGVTYKVQIGVDGKVTLTGDKLEVTGNVLVADHYRLPEYRRSTDKVVIWEQKDGSNWDGLEHTNKRIRDAADACRTVERLLIIE